MELQAGAMFSTWNTMDVQSRILVCFLSIFIVKYSWSYASAMSVVVFLQKNFEQLFLSITQSATFIPIMQDDNTKFDIR